MVTLPCQPFILGVEFGVIFLHRREFGFVQSLPSSSPSSNGTCPVMSFIVISCIRGAHIIAFPPRLAFTLRHPHTWSLPPGVESQSRVSCAFSMVSLSIWGLMSDPQHWMPRKPDGSRASTSTMPNRSCRTPCSPTCGLNRSTTSHRPPCSRMCRIVRCTGVSPLMPSAFPFSNGYMGFFSGVECVPKIKY